MMMMMMRKRLELCIKYLRRISSKIHNGVKILNTHKKNFLPELLFVGETGLGERLGEPETQGRVGS